MNLRPNLEDILFSGKDYQLITRGINSLYEKFSQATQVCAGDLTHEHMRETPNGIIVTPGQAAHCLKDIDRSTHFLRGIYKAIECYLKNRKSIRILYAGCGPYATLLTPFTALYGHDRIRFTFLEIEKVSHQAVTELYTDWGLTSYLEEVRLTDATDPSIQFPDLFDIIISETMQVGLKNECQVPITRNLRRFLKEDGTFIPQQVRLDVYLTGQKRDPLIPDSDEKFFVGTAFDFDFRKIPGPGSEVILDIPASDLHFLKLYTAIHLFGDEKLMAYQSGLTLPLLLDRRVDKGGARMQFWYEEGSRPCLQFKYTMKEKKEKRLSAIASHKEQGELRINHLRRFWSKAMVQRAGSTNQWQEEFDMDRALLDCLGLGLEPTLSYLYQYAPSFPEFESWISTQTNLGERTVFVERFNNLFESHPNNSTARDFLSPEDLRFFDEQGYVIIRNVLSEEECFDTVKVITGHLHIDLQRTETWYAAHTSRQGIMVNFFKHEVLERNRYASKIRKAYECLWRTSNLWVSTDRVGFNPPETETWKFPGTHLHLDIQPQIPFPFGLQGILYLTDTEENQGALTVVPGFHKRIEQWMHQFGPGKVPLTGVFDQFEKKSIAANAGDFIIWHHGLPHGSSPNTNTRPRIVQYINLYPVRSS